MIKGIIFKWCYWWFITAKRCPHIESYWMMREFGMGKVRWCKKCGKCLELI